MTERAAVMILQYSLHGGHSRSLAVSGRHYMCFACGLRGATKKLPHRTWSRDAANDVDSASDDTRGGS